MSGFSRRLSMSSFQRKVEMFHNTQAEFGDRGEGYVSRTIALVNCCPPLRYSRCSAALWFDLEMILEGNPSCLTRRSLVERCRQCDPQGSEDSAQRANSSLDRIINQSVRVLTERLLEHIRVGLSFKTWKIIESFALRKEQCFIVFIDLVKNVSELLLGVLPAFFRQTD